MAETYCKAGKTLRDGSKIMIKKLTIMGLLMAVTQAGYAINVSSQGHTVLIEDAISKAGVKANIHLIETAPDGSSRMVPLENAQGVEYELNGRDLRISTAAAQGRYHSISIVRVENGNRQSMRVSIGGNSSSNISSGSGSNSTSVSSTTSVVQHGSRQKKSAAPKPAMRDRAGSWINQQIKNEDLSGTSFAGSAVVNSRFEADQLGHTDFSGSSVTNTRFLQCELNQADFRGSQLVNVKFEHSDLRSANFRGAGMVGVDFHQSDLSGAIWIDGQVCKPGSVGKCDL